ncbi:MAG: fatty acid desaturase [Acidobacteria bacterium]|nr:fatty acid desaturase [Acidobacteriota bacterium]
MNGKKTRYYYEHIGDLKGRLAAAIPRQQLRELHEVRSARHFLVVGRLLLTFLAAGWALWQSRWPWLWAPAVILQGFTYLGFVILLHEQVHKIIFPTSRPKAERFLGLFYAALTGISATQFSVWHLDHHDQLGSEVEDPKRAHLSPKRNRRWFKLLYFTPALFFLYFKGAMKEARSYPPEVQKTIRRERLANTAFHLAVMATISYFGGPWVLLRVYVIPLFFGFPVAFSVNRLGQHYNIDPEDPAKWSTRVDGNPAWHFLMVWSNFHLEHHYYQRVPFYNLKKLNRALHPFFLKTGIPNRSYRELLWGWFAHNFRAHTRWARESRG